MKKLDKKILITVILGLLMVSILSSLVSMMNNGFANVIAKGTPIYSAFYIISGILLNAPIIFFILRLANKDEKIRFIIPLINLAVMLVIFIFGVVFAFVGFQGSGGVLVATCVELLVTFLILDLPDFKEFINGLKNSTTKEPTKKEEKVEEKSEEEVNKTEEVVEEIKEESIIENQDK